MKKVKLRQVMAQFLTKHYAPKAPKVDESKIRIACVGDSITFGTGVLADYKHGTWEYFLQQKLGEEYQVLNYGISGRTLQDEGDYPYRKEQFYAISREIQADIYILMLGTNDSKPQNWNYERYKEQFVKFVDSYKHLGNKPQVYIMAPPKCFPNKETGVIGGDISDTIVGNDIRNFILEYAKNTGISCIDLYPYTTGHPEWFDDGIHPNVTGNEAFADYIYSHLTLMKA